VVEGAGATVGVVLGVTAGADRAKLAQRFGLRRAAPPRWAAPPAGAPLAIRELPELQVELVTAEAGGGTGYLSSRAAGLPHQ
jgi:hypothetical protein